MIEGFTIKPLQQNSDLVPIARAYAEVFAGQPWNENTVCAVGCNSFFGLETVPGQPCPNNDCEGQLSEAYPLEQTTREFAMDIARPGSSVNLVLKDQEVAGFSIGFPWTAVDFALQKYKTEQMREQVVRILIAQGLDEFQYVSEIGLKAAYRGMGISNLLVEDLVQNCGLYLPSSVVLRTNFSSPMVAVCSRLGMTQIYGPEVSVTNGNGPKKIEVKPNLVNGVTDIDNPNRVLYVAKRIELPYAPNGACR